MCTHSASLSLLQDVVDECVRTFRSAALRVAGTRGQSVRVPRGQSVHDAGQTLQTGRSGRSVHPAHYKTPEHKRVNQSIKTHEHTTGDVI